MDSENERKLIEILELADTLKNFESIEKIGPVAIRLIGSHIHLLTATILRDYPRAPKGDE